MYGFKAEARLGPQLRNLRRLALIRRGPKLHPKVCTNSHSYLNPRYPLCGLTLTITVSCQSSLLRCDDQPPSVGSIGMPSIAQHVKQPQCSTGQSELSTRMSKRSGYGGFPMPLDILGSIFRRLFPKLQTKLTRSVTYPATVTITSQHGGARTADGSKIVPYISFDAIVGRNSTFHFLNNEQLEEL